MPTDIRLFVGYSLTGLTQMPVLLNLYFWEAVVLAVILAPTDAALGQAVVSSPRVPVRIRQALNVESGLNDGIALPILLFFVSLAEAGAQTGSAGYWIQFAAMQRAVKLCPHLIIVPSRHHVYQDVSRQVMALLHNLTPLVEPLSIDKAFLDITELPQSSQAIVRQLQATIQNELNLPCSLGVATNKLVAKIANNIGKASAKTKESGTPQVITVVPPDQEAPLPIRELWGVGPKTAARLLEMNVHTIGDMAHRSETDLVRRFGKLGHDLVKRAQGIDTRPVETESQAKSISQETTFVRDINDSRVLHQTLRHLAEQVGHRLRKSDLSGTTIKLKIRWSDFTTLTRQVTLNQPTNMDSKIYTAITHLFEQVWPPGKRVRLLGIGVSNFEAPARQLGLWDTDLKTDNQFQTTLDELRERFGTQAVQRGSQLKGKKREI